MGSLFQVGFQKEAWKPTLGTLEETITDLLEKGSEVYKTSAEVKIAEAEAEAKQAEADAAKARAAAVAASAMAQKPVSTVFGIPTNYLLYGGLALGATALIVTLAKKKKK